MKIEVDQDKCIGCGTCPAIAPKSFRINEETNKAEVIVPVGDNHDTIRMAAEACPVGAIVIVEE